MGLSIALQYPIDLSDPLDLWLHMLERRHYHISVSCSWDLISNGFRRIVHDDPFGGGDVNSTAYFFHRLMNGPKRIKPDELIASLKFDGYTREDNLITWLSLGIKIMEQRDIRKFLLKVTGTDRTHFGGCELQLQPIVVCDCGSSNQIFSDINESRLSIPRFASEEAFTEAWNLWLSLFSYPFVF